MSIPEILVSLVIATFLISIVLAGWYYAYKNWAIDRVRTELRVNLEMAVERLKGELRLSSATYMSLYKPEGGSEYAGVSFPAATLDGNGFFILDADENIFWDKSIIYYVYENVGTGEKELRREEIADNNAVLINETLRDAQLQSVIGNEDGETLISGVSDFFIEPKAQEFDGYSDPPKRSDNIMFGSIRLTPGDHDFKFEVSGDVTPEGKNSSSDGWAMGIDTLSITPSGCQQEMDAYSPSDSSGDGTTKTGPDSMWSGNFFTEYNSDEIGDSVTYTVNYDTWLECNFANAVKTNTILTGDDLCIKLPDRTEGNDLVWQAEFEAGSGLGASSRDDFPSLANITVRNLVSFENIASDGDLVMVFFAASSAAPLRIVEAYIAKCVLGQSAAGPPDRAQLFFTDSLGNITPDTTILANSTAHTNWTIFPVSSEQSYFVTFYVADDADNSFASY